MNDMPFVNMPVRRNPPANAVRVMPREVLRVFLQDWRNFLQGIDSRGPQLTRPGKDRVFVTDPESIFCCTEATGFNTRLGLGYSTDEGCSVVFLNSEGLDMSIPQLVPGASENGLTIGGAREWIINDNPHLDMDQDGMEVFEVNELGQRFGPLS